MIKQRLGLKGLMAFITFLSAFIPLTTDIYLPALPGMASEMGTTGGMANLTLVAFFGAFAVSTLLWGPLSDRLGRKYSLQIGLALYTLSSLGCMLSPSIGWLIGSRILQAVGAGSASAVGTAIIKDSFTDRKKRETIMAFSMSAAMIAPIVAPVLGAALLQWLSWRALFGVLTLLGALAFAVACIYTETLLPSHRSKQLWKSLGSLGAIAANTRFSSLLLTFSLMAVTSLGFVSASAYIYMEDFRLSQQAYSYFFALNALFIVLGPLCYVKFTSSLDARKLVTLAYAISLSSSLLICLLGSRSPWFFALLLLPSTFMSSHIRPFTTNMLLDMQQGHAGAASSLINFTFQVLGCLGMALMAPDWEHRIAFFGALGALVSLSSLILWTLHLRTERGESGESLPLTQEG